MLEVVDVGIEQDVVALEELILKLSWLGRRRLEQELDAYGLTVPQFMALRCISERDEGCSMSELAESSKQAPATMTGVIDRLEERNLVRRARDQHDRRAQRVLLTRKGSELLERVRERRRAWIHQFVSALPEEDRKAMLTLGRRYLAVIEATVTTD